MVAKVHALATASGCQLVASYDLVVVAESTAFAISRGLGGLFCYTPLVAVARSLSPKRAIEMAMTRNVILAKAAYARGVTIGAAPDEDRDTAVIDFLARATRGSKESKTDVQQWVS